ncbi:hypothetical protein AVEN_220808-1 [Araneus ventricosus]|uniref:Uncharacterized protein n=1 Tax=Araneus ventricosus TaxID=182803 RepID=A0A4Y2TME5_ARAVE|nr:hypothetical protein AVEN_220808-1 [Araneus ventricosus]
MAARNVPSAVEGQLKRKPNEMHSRRKNGDHHFFPHSREHKTVSMLGARSEDGRGCRWLCDDLVTAFRKPNSSPFPLTNILVLDQ